MATVTGKSRPGSIVAQAYALKAADERRLARIKRMVKPAEPVAPVKKAKKPKKGVRK